MPHPRHAAELRSRVFVTVKGYARARAFDEASLARDPTLVTAHSEKEQAKPTFKRGFGFHPLWAFIDHGPDGPGNPPRCCSAGETPARTPRPTTSPWPRPRWLSYPDGCAVPARS
ncbi:hypothetical protein Franean1_3052 [Parafrankia sp. EAN1pec]|nr:hypothetical protein Franean1_3052 [Frankia sp. EAN1pec]